MASFRTEKHPDLVRLRITEKAKSTRRDTVYNPYTRHAAEARKVELQQFGVFHVEILPVWVVVLDTTEGGNKPE
ncbi:MAG: hypothetical protein ACYTFQ_00250 [Planctomycetota bacterium]|jgi:hypothetical protein